MYGAHLLILLMSVLGIPYCDIRLLQLEQGAAGPPESLGKSAARISPAGTPRTIPGRARPGCPWPPRGTQGSTAGTEGAYATEQGGLLWLVGLAGLALKLALAQAPPLQVLAKLHLLCIKECTHMLLP